MNSASISCLTLMWLGALRCTYFVRDFLTGFSCFLWAVVRFPYEIWCFGVHHFRVRVPHESSCLCFLVHNLLMRCHAYWAVTRFAHEMSCFSFPNEISSDFRRSCDFLTPMRFPYEISCFLVGYVSNETFLVRYYALQLHTYLMTLHAFGLFRDFHMRISYMLFEA